MKPLIRFISVSLAIAISIGEEQAEARCSKTSNMKRHTNETPRLGEEESGYLVTVHDRRARIWIRKRAKGFVEVALIILFRVEVCEVGC
jgi:hypothetical protein